MKVTVLTCGLLLLAGSAAAQGPIEWSSNGHVYELVPLASDWDTARATAELKGGYLATITSQQEQDFIVNNVVTPQSRYAWIGATQRADGVEPDQGWEWITGETWEYDAWGPGQPDNAPSLDEDCTNFLLYAGQVGDWNDEECSRSDVYFIVEYEKIVPSASTWGVGILAILIPIAATLALRGRRLAVR
jgi:hypothetical protein